MQRRHRLRSSSRLRGEEPGNEGLSDVSSQRNNNKNMKQKETKQVNVGI